jgi:hypothetical protein
LEVGPAAADGPRVGLASLFLIQTEEGAFERNPLRLAGDSGEMERRPLYRTRVHSLAVIICSTNVVGANTGILTPCQLVGLTDDGGLAGAGSGDATSHDAQSSARSHRRDSKLFELVKFKHENRASNGEAHRLARSAASSNSGRQVWLVAPPDGLCI